MMMQGKVWGNTTPLFNRHNVEVHYIHIKKGGYCSRHRHKHKYNQFIVFDGKLKVNVWKDYGNGQELTDVTILTNKSECVVPPGDMHNFEALEDTVGLEIYWVDLDTKDIERYDVGGMKDEETTSISTHERRGREGTDKDEFLTGLRIGGCAYVPLNHSER